MPVKPDDYIQRCLKIYRNCIREDGALYFKTDETDLFEWGLEQLVREGWRIERFSFDLHESDLNNHYEVMTTYESRFTKEGLKINCKGFTAS